MKLPTHKWLLLFFMLWFPVQGAAAAVLSVCVQENINHHTEQALQTSSGHHHDDCHQQTAEDSNQHILVSLPCEDISCDAYSHTPILPEHVAPIVISNLSIISTYISGFVSFVPEQPQRPPLTA